MKKIVLILIAATMLFAACNSNTEPTAKHDFRDVDFGMSTIELLEIEGEPDDERQYDDLAVYVYENRNAFGVDNAMIQYQIDKNGVGWAQAAFQNEYVDDKSYITEYNTVKKNLIAAWGEPESIDENESEFNFSCTWENKSLTLNIVSGNKAFLRVTVSTPEFLESSLKRIQEKQKERQNSEASE